VQARLTAVTSFGLKDDFVQRQTARFGLGYHIGKGIEHGAFS
jgi:hypothetical protein